jgi:hypothetical protein
MNGAQFDEIRGLSEAEGKAYAQWQLRGTLISILDNLLDEHETARDWQRMARLLGYAQMMAGILARRDGWRRFQAALSGHEKTNAQSARKNQKHGQ